MPNFSFNRKYYQPQPRTLFQDDNNDGDTLKIVQPVRMVSCDTPEKANYAGKPSVSQPKLDKCKERLEEDFFNIPVGMKNYLLSKLQDGQAAAKHIEAGQKATAFFNQILEDRLTKEDGKKRQLAIIPSGEAIDSYGRLLAYFSPYYKNTSADPLPPKGSKERETFNLNMIESGWSAFFPIYPSLPQNDDFNLALERAKEAYIQKKGVWGDYGETILLGYEFRLCIKLGTAKTANAGLKEAFQRICIDLENMQIKGKYEFDSILPYNRLWVWEKDLEQAKIDLGLTS